MVDEVICGRYQARQLDKTQTGVEEGSRMMRKYDQVGRGLLLPEGCGCARIGRQEPSTSPCRGGCEGDQRMAIVGCAGRFSRAWSGGGGLVV